MGSSLGFKEKTILLFLLVALASNMMVVSSAGTPRKLIEEEEDHPVRFEMETSKVVHKGKTQAAGSHPRILKVQTNDYGRYDPAPELEKPSFKLIPN